ncbi:MAG: PilZ domain-containing protein [Deltaproteobacteria bacterium]|nr:PilZ domain-containing protein [Deltaproteobacteria bacterium]MBW2150326.1 PilZ domain-containing protein [Deltaproteobacteria bacterium]
MINTQKKKRFLERRKEKRLAVQEGALAVLHNQKYKIGPIIDISHGGLSFRYVDGEKQPIHSFALSIFFTGEAFRIRKLPFKTIYDIQENPKKGPSYVLIRRIGGQFGKLTTDQRSVLGYFIENYKITEY